MGERLRAMLGGAHYPVKPKTAPVASAEGCECYSRIGGVPCWGHGDKPCAAMEVTHRAAPTGGNANALHLCAACAAEVAAHGWPAAAVVGGRP